MSWAARRSSGVGSAVSRRAWSQRWAARMGIFSPTEKTQGCDDTISLKKELPQRAQDSSNQRTNLSSAAQAHARKQKW